MKHENIRHASVTHGKQSDKKMAEATRPPSVEPWCEIYFICHNCNLPHSDEARKCDILQQKGKRGHFAHDIETNQPELKAETKSIIFEKWPRQDNDY